jgi:nucleotide-binding universal stress UspA family protein
MKNILLLIHDDAGQEARLQAALDITRAVGGHLKCLDVTPVTVLPGDGYGSDGSVIMLTYEQQQESANKARLLKRMEAEDVSWEWADATGVMEHCIEDAARTADLIVVNRQLEDYPIPDMRRICSELVVKSGVPVLAVPEDVIGFKAAGNALVAWDGSSEAAAALTAAVPLLQLASSVTIFEVDDGSIKSPAEEAATYLSRHGIHPLVVEEKAYGERASGIVLDKASSGLFDYLVMGGFSHSRFVEALFGGVSRRMLKESPIPLFLAH